MPFVDFKSFKLTGGFRVVKVIFPDGTERDLEEGVSLFEVYKEHDKSVLKKSCAVRVGGVLKDLSSTLEASASPVAVEPVLTETKEGLDVYRHSVSHIMAEAVKSLYDNVKVAK